MTGTTFEVMAEKCDSCIFRGGNPMHLNEGRVQQMVADCQEKNTHVVCHKSPQVTGSGDRGIACRGFLDAYPYVSLSQRMAEAFGIPVVEVDPATLTAVESAP